MEKKRGFKFLFMSLMALVGLGMEVILVLLIEPMIYGLPSNEWNISQQILNWILICILWGIASYILINISKKKLNFDIFKKGAKMSKLQWILILLLIVVALIKSYAEWNGLKVVKEFMWNGWLRFIFQYIYYVFETMLVMMIVIFGQEAFESWFSKSIIPYGGIITALTWGLSHNLTKGNMIIALACASSAILYGIVYELTNRNAKIAFSIMVIMMIL